MVHNNPYTGPVQLANTKQFTGALVNMMDRMGYHEEQKIRPAQKKKVAEELEYKTTTEEDEEKEQETPTVAPTLSVATKDNGASSEKKMALPSSSSSSNSSVCKLFHDVLIRSCVFFSFLFTHCPYLWCVCAYPCASPGGYV
jgi:hypothetical protein